MKFLNYEKPILNAFMDMFVAIKKLTTYYSLDQAIDVLDNYFKTNDVGFITMEDGIRNFVVESKIRDEIFPLIDGKYNNLFDFIDELCEFKKIK